MSVSGSVVIRIRIHMDPEFSPGSGSGTRKIQSWIRIRIWNKSFRIHNTSGHVKQKNFYNFALKQVQYFAFKLSNNTPVPSGWTKLLYVPIFAIFCILKTEDQKGVGKTGLQHFTYLKISQTLSCLTGATIRYLLRLKNWL